jgi:putative hydrolase of the HAD superfamily
MHININSDSFFVFDLDDTLFPEYDFLQSGYRQIASLLMAVAGADLYNDMLRRYNNKENVFSWLVDAYRSADSRITMEWLLKIYREHLPDISLDKATARFLHQLKEKAIPAALVTDGRSLTQRNKLKALGIENYFSEIIISEEFGSEKPDERNYLYFQHKYHDKEFYFFGDNTAKDFIVPARLGWRTVCMMDTGRHIHTQTFDQPTVPDFIISSFDEVILSP